MNLITLHNFTSISHYLKQMLFHEKDIELEIKFIYQLLSETLFDMSYFELCNQLPLIKYSIDAIEASRMSKIFLSDHQLIVDEDACDLLLFRIFEQTFLTWTYMIDFDLIKNTNASEFRGFQSQGKLIDAEIQINLKDSIIQINLFDNEDINKGQNFSYIIKIPGNISGKSIKKILTHSRFLNLVQNIEEYFTNILNCYDFNRESHLISLSKKDHELILKDIKHFQDFINLSEIELSDITDPGNCLNAFGIDAMENVVDLENSVEITLMYSLSMRINSKCNLNSIKILAKEELKHLTKTCELENLIDQYYEIVCKNSITQSENSK